MKSKQTASRLLARLAATALTAGLVGVSGVAHAGAAQVAVTGFYATSTDGYVFATDQYQSWNLQASNGGGAPNNQVMGGQADWTPVAFLAQATQALARANTETFTDPLTQLTTVGFTALANGTLPATASAGFTSGGAFTLLDFNTGDQIAGSITFDVYFDLTADSTGDSPYFSQAMLGLLVSSSGGSMSFGDNVSTEGVAGEMASKSGHFSWTLAIGAGESALYSLSGLAVASVPEPTGIALAVLGLVGLGATRRRRAAPALLA